VGGDQISLRLLQALLSMSLPRWLEFPLNFYVSGRLGGVL
jgi:hypothetical protein